MEFIQLPTPHGEYLTVNPAHIVAVRGVVAIDKAKARMEIYTTSATLTSRPMSLSFFKISDPKEKNTEYLINLEQITTITLKRTYAQTGYTVVVTLTSGNNVNLVYDTEQLAKAAHAELVKYLTIRNASGGGVQTG